MGRHRVAERLPRVVSVLGVDEVPPDLPIFCDFKQVTHLNAGTMLCIEEEQRQSVTVPLLVCCVTYAEEQAGFKYDGQKRLWSTVTSSGRRAVAHGFTLRVARMLFAFGRRLMV